MSSLNFFASAWARGEEYRMVENTEQIGVERNLINPAQENMNEHSDNPTTLQNLDIGEDHDEAIRTLHVGKMVGMRCANEQEVVTALRRSQRRK